MNQVHLVGNVTHDLELRQSQHEIKYTQFRLAVDDRSSKGKKTSFIDVVAFGRQAEILAQHVAKGEKLFVAGRLTTSRFVNPDGSSVSKIKVILDTFEFAGRRSSYLAKTHELSQNA